MTQRTVKPDKIKSLMDWVANWPKARNLGFDPVTREPTVYSIDKDRNKILSIPWKRSGDILTILSQPSQFPAEVVQRALADFNETENNYHELRDSQNEELKKSETALINAWRAYNAAVPANKASLRRAIMTAERGMRQAEDDMIRSVQSMVIDYDGFKMIYTAPLQIGEREISLTGSA